MKKILIGSAIAFLMIFTAGLATAGSHGPPPLTTFTYTTGNLSFIAAGATTPTQVTGASITLSLVAPPNPNTAGQPGDIWSGTLTLPDSSPIGAATVAISAFRGPDDPKLFHDIHGSVGTGALGAEGENGVVAKDLSVSPTKYEKGFYIRGTISDGSTFVGNFEGTLFP